MIAYYAQRAKEYDRVYRKPERQSDLAYLKDYVAQAFQGQTVLEVACGTGYWTQYLAQQAHSVVAMDASAEVLEIARTKKFFRQNVDFELADMYALPKSDRKFEAGFGGFIWSHIPLSRLSNFLTSLHQHLKKGGKVMFVDNRYVSGSSTSLATKDEEGNTFQKRQLENGEEYLVLKNFPSEKDIKTALSDTARDIQFTPLTYYWAITYTIA